MLASPNNGTYIAKWIVDEAPSFLTDLTKWVCENLWAGVVLGDEESDFINATRSMTEEYMSGIFNPTLLTYGRKTPEIPIFNYSYSLKGAQANLNGLIIFPLWCINYFGTYEGRTFLNNDGVVITDSAAWTPSKEEQMGNSPWTYMGNNVGYDPDPFLPKHGVDHWMLVNHFINLEDTAIGIDSTPDFDTVGLYKDIAYMLMDAAAID